MVVRDLGHVDYLPTIEAMKAFTQARGDETPDELWVLEHPSVFTQGIAGKEEHLLAPGEIEVIRTDRGGQVTYHGPGQLVIYLLIDLTRRKLGVRNLVSVIEQAIVRTLAQGGIEAAPRSDAPGVYVNGAKIASLGLRVRRGCSFHGLALNVNMDMEPFSRINPCGYAGMSMCQVSDFEAGASVYDLERRLVSELVEGLGHCQVEQRQGW